MFKIERYNDTYSIKFKGKTIDLIKYLLQHNFDTHSKIYDIEISKCKCKLNKSKYKIIKGIQQEYNSFSDFLNDIKLRCNENQFKISLNFTKEFRSYK